MLHTRRAGPEAFIGSMDLKMGTLPHLPLWVEEEFPILEKWLFFNHAGVAPICRRAAQALNQYAQQSLSDAYVTGQWHRQIEQIRRVAASFIKARPEEIAFVKNTSEGLAFVANGLNWNRGDEIISTQAEYPANVYPWLDLQARMGVKFIQVPQREGRIDLADIVAAFTPRTRMVTISHVEFSSGYCNDLVALGAACKQAGVLLCVDAIQSLGALPVDVEAMHIDFLAADGHKWLLAPEGCGIFYCRHKLQPLLRPEIGWMNVANPLDFDTIDFRLREDARRFECGTYNVGGVLALGAALGLLTEIGHETLRQRILGLTDLLADQLTAGGWEIFSPRGPGEKSGIISFSRPGLDTKTIAQTLQQQHRVILAVRAGRLRLSPHFYQTPEHIARVLEALSASVG